MTNARSLITRGIFAALLLAGSAPGAWGQAAETVPGAGVGSYPGDLIESETRIRGTIMCVGCSLEEARRMLPEAKRLYAFTHDQGQWVMQVNDVDNPSRWEQMTLSNQLRVRGTEDALQQLSAGENRGKEVEIAGFLRHDQVLDITGVTIGG